MNITVQALHLDVDDTIRAYAKDKFQKVERFNANIQSIEVLLKGDDRKAHCEAILHVASSGTVVIDVARDEIQEAIDLAVGKCERQLRRLKEKQTGRRRQKATAAAPSTQADDDDENTSEDY